MAAEVPALQTVQSENESSAESFIIAVVEHGQIARNLRCLHFSRKTSLPGRNLRTSSRQSRMDSFNEEEEEVSCLNNGVDACFEQQPLECYIREEKPKSGTLILQRKSSKRQSCSSFVDLSSIDSVEMEGIGLSVLGTIAVSSAPRNNTYIGYIQKVLKISDKRMSRLCDLAQKEENTELQLACSVRGATHLLLKDHKGSLPDVVCHLAVVSRDKQMDSFFRDHNALDWHQHGVVSEVKLTKFASATMRPVWNESFHLHLNDPADDMLAVEIWGRKNKDHIQTLGKKPKEYYKKPENFIGRAFYVLKTTPLEGEERTLTLCSHSGKHERGKVTLQLSIKGQREDVPIDVSIREHTIFYKLIVNHESQANGTPISPWDAKLSTEAETVLLKHIELTGITILQEYSTRLSVLLEYHKFNGVKLASFAKLVEEIVKHKTLPPHTDHVWVKQLLFDLLSLHSQMLEVVRDHLVKFNIKASADINEIASCLRILKAMYSYPPLLNKLNKDEINIKSTLEICIQVAVPRWFLELSKSLLRTSCADGEMELITLKGLCIHCLRHCLRAHRILNPIFESVGINYFTGFYVALDKLLCGEAMPRIRHFTSKLKEPIVYELYMVIKDLAKQSEHVVGLQHVNLEILTFHKYFEGLPLVWLELATGKCKLRVEKAISLDEKPMTGSDQARYSSSSVDTEGFLLQLGLFWKNLEWPIATDAIGYLCTVVEHISQLSLFYVDNLYKTLLLDSAIMYDAQGRFQSSERLCIILNNMYHVKRTLSEMPATLEVEKYCTWLNTNCKQLGDKAKKLVDSLLSSNDEDIDNKLSYFVDRITERLTPDISFFFEVIIPVTSGSHGHGGRHLGSILKSSSNNDATGNGINWPWHNKETEELLTNEEAITPLLNYLAANLQILGDFLLTPVLNGILYKLWNVVIGVVQGRMIVIPRKSSTMYLFERLEYFMKELKSFFHAEGSGMSLPSLETEAYRFIINKVQLLRTEARDLLERYLWELSEQQKYKDNYSVNGTSGGSLQISMGYLIDESVVEVSIIQAGNLPGNAQLNTYVEVHLLPNWLFAKSGKKTLRTAATKGTRNPYYGVEFQLPAKRDNLSKIGSVLLLLVCDEETNTILGTSAVHGMEIPHLYAHVQSLAQENIPERRKLTLSLFLQKDSPVLKEIESRLEANEQEIVDFYKSNKRVFEQYHFRKYTLSKWLSH